MSKVLVKTLRFEIRKSRMETFAGIVGKTIVPLQTQRVFKLPPKIEWR